MKPLIMDTINGYWYIAAAGSELKDKPIKRKVEGESLVLWRDHAGNPRALQDRGAHRGMARAAGKVSMAASNAPTTGMLMTERDASRIFHHSAVGSAFPR